LKERFERLRMRLRLIIMQRLTVTALLLLCSRLIGSSTDDAAERLYNLIHANDLKSLKVALQETEVDVRDRHGATPLMHAAAIGSIEAMSLLLDRGADVNARNAFDATALMWALGDPPKSRLLIDRGADVNARSKQGRTPLLIGAKRDGGSDLLRLLLSKGADPNVRDERGNTALMLAAQTGDLETMRLLVAKGAEVNAANPLGFTSLSNAVTSNRIDAVKFLLDKGSNPNAVTVASIATVKHGPLAFGKATPLMLAAPYASSELIAALLNAGADVNARDVRAMTSLMLAVASETQDVEVVKLLLRAGADPNVRSASGETAFDWANKYGSPSVLNLLKRAGAQGSSPPIENEPAERRAANVNPATALRQSLDFVQASSTKYFKESGCVGCHHQLDTGVAVRVARDHGIQVDEKGARDRLASMRAELALQQELLLQGVDVFGSQVLAPFLFGMAESGYSPDPITDSAVVELMSLQSVDGSWNRGLGVSRSPIQEGNIARTTEAIRALRYFGPPARKAEIEDRIARARTWLRHANSRTAEDAVMILLGLRWSDAGRYDVQKASRSLSSQQRQDGGWAGNPNLASDAYSTSKALYALHETGVSVQDASYKRGIDFLLRTRQDDGTWYVRSRAPKIQPYFESGFPYSGDQWISAAGTAWAAAALATAVDSRNVEQPTGR
jgi:ankyrin repeat protein